MTTPLGPAPRKLVDALDKHFLELLTRGRMMFNAAGLPVLDASGKPRRAPATTQDLMEGVGWLRQRERPYGGAPALPDLTPTQRKLVEAMDKRVADLLILGRIVVDSDGCPVLDEQGKPRREPATAADCAEARRWLAQRWGI